MDYEVYSFGNNAALVQLFHGVAAIMGSGDFLGLLKTVAIIGLMVSVLYSLGKNSFTAPNWFFSTMLIYMAMFVPKANVIVVDRLNTTPPAVIANVPLSLAFFAHITSKIGDWSTTTMEAAFSLPEDLKYQKKGLLFGAKLVSASRSFKIQDPVLESDFYKFMTNCAYYDINTYKTYTMQTLRASTNPIEVIKNTNSVLFTTVGSSNTTVTCKTAMDGDGAASVVGLVARLEAEVTKNKTFYARSLNPKAASLADAVTQLESNLPAAMQAMAQVGSDASTIMRQNMMINVLHNSDAETASQLDNPAAVAIALAQAQAQMSTKNTYLVMAKLAEEALPLIRNAIEAIVIGVFPFVFLLFMLSGNGAGKGILSYAMTLLWLQLWAPLYAILNLIATANTADNIYSLTSVYGGVTAQNANEVASAALSAQSVAGFMVLSIPTIAYAIVKGGEMAMSSLASGLMAPAASASGQAGAQAATGNWSMGNRQYDNMSANKTNTDFENFSGNSTTRDSHNRKTLRTQGGDAYMSDQGAISDLGKHNIEAKGAVAQAMRTQSGNEFNSALEHGKTSAVETAAGLTTMMSIATQRANDTKSGTSNSNSNDASDLRTLNTTSTQVTEWGKKNGYTAAQAAEVMAYVNGSAGLKALGNGVETGFKVSGKSTAATQQELSEAKKFSEQISFAKAVSAGKRLSASNTFTTSDGRAVQGTEGANSSFTKGQKESESSSAKFAKSMKWSKTAEKVNSNEIQVGTKLNQEYLDWLATEPPPGSGGKGTLGQSGAMAFVRDMPDDMVRASIDRFVNLKAAAILNSNGVEPVADASAVELNYKKNRNEVKGPEAVKARNKADNKNIVDKQNNLNVNPKEPAPRDGTGAERGILKTNAALNKGGANLKAKGAMSKRAAAPATSNTPLLANALINGATQLLPNNSVAENRPPPAGVAPPTRPPTHPGFLASEGPSMLNQLTQIPGNERAGAAPEPATQTEHAQKTAPADETAPGASHPAQAPAKDALQQIDGMSESDVRALANNGIKSWTDLARMPVNEVMRITGENEAHASQLVANAQRRRQ